MIFFNGSNGELKGTELMRRVEEKTRTYDFCGIHTCTDNLESYAGILLDDLFVQI